MDKKHPLAGEIADVLVSINSALDFTKIISTLYTGLPINFFKHVTGSEMAPLPWETSNRGKQITYKIQESKSFYTSFPE